jgi:hypothetical protein
VVGSSGRRCMRAGRGWSWRLSRLKGDNGKNWIKKTDAVARTTGSSGTHPSGILRCEDVREEDLDLGGSAVFCNFPFFLETGGSATVAAAAVFALRVMGIENSCGWSGTM